MTLRIGTAAWAIPRDVRDSFPPAPSNLERYAGRFACTEINSSFHRPHRRSTYERWAASVSPDFRFAVKLPKAISHEARMANCEEPLTRFAEETAGLGDKLGPVLVQLPPSFAFDRDVADLFFRMFAAIVGAQMAIEPRHPSWFEPVADTMLKKHRVARVAADPCRVPGAEVPGGWSGLAYFRLHGSPQIYRSSYDPEALSAWLTRAACAQGDAWVIFDNTTSGAATSNAVELLHLAT